MKFGCGQLVAGVLFALQQAAAGPIEKRNIFQYGSTPVRGVNIGGWLVLEPWIKVRLPPCNLVLRLPSACHGTWECNEVSWRAQSAGCDERD